MSRFKMPAKPVAASFLALSIAIATFAENARADGHSPANHVDFDKIAWQETGLPGTQIALLWGTEEANNAIWAVRMVPGASLPQHAHSNDYWGLTIKGDWVHIDKDGKESISKPGFYAFIKGSDFHADRCDGAEPCVFILDFEGARDLVLPKQ